MILARPERLSLFGSLVHYPDGDIPLCQAALLFAADAQPTLNIEGVLGDIAKLGGAIAGQLPQLDSTPTQEILSQFLRIFHHELGFRGDTETKDAPENSLLHRVLERRRGLPITLCVLAVEFLRRAGVEAYGVALPGHFVARCETEEGPIWFDPFHPGPDGGTLMDQEDCARLVARQGLVLQGTALRQALSPARKQATLIRMLNNLTLSYDRRRMDLQKAQTYDWLLLLQPGDMNQTFLRGMSYHLANMPGLAMRDLERFLHQMPQHPQAPAAREILQALHRKLSQN